MADHPFENLRLALLRLGVAPRHARRTVLELDRHLHQLIQEGLQRGDSEESAHLAARDLLGTDEVLLNRYAEMPELRSWASRWPAVWFTLVPLICCVVLFVAMIAILCSFGELMSAYLQHVHVSARVSSRSDWLVQIVFLWVLPLSIAAAFAVLAYRQRVALHWPIAGIAIVCCLVALINVSVVLTGGTPSGSVGAGIGISGHSLPGQMAHAMGILLPVVGPLWLACRRRRVDRATLD
jgi:hypothetical protein